MSGVSLSWLLTVTQNLISSYQFIYFLIQGTFGWESFFSF